jgi:hypothetical protein
LKFGDQWERLELTLHVNTSSPQSAVDIARLPVEMVLDDLSFRFQTALPVGQAEILDVSPPLEIGKQRDFFGLPMFPRWKFSATRATENRVERRPELRSNYPALSDRQRRALDWYVKGLGATADADRFMFFWVALEIMERARDRRIQVPYTAPCGHEIPTCPECGRSTDKTVAGANIQTFLHEFGLSLEDARKLWRMRQMVHGDQEFGSAEMMELPTLVQLLGAAVTHSLKGAIGLRQDAPPIVVAGGWVGDMGIEGTREITAADVAAAHGSS